MNRDDILNEYFNWLCDIVVGKRFNENLSFTKLLVHLHETPFEWYIRNDSNRAEDGKSLRFRFGLYLTDNDFEEADQIANTITRGVGGCSVLEMMTALSIRCEEDIMNNASIGDRSGHWFWRMIACLHLNGMSNDHYDHVYVDECLQTFMKRTYAPDGDGGLFRIPGIDADLREVEIWYQLLWYLDTIV